MQHPQILSFSESLQTFSGGASGICLQQQRVRRQQKVSFSTEYTVNCPVRASMPLRRNAISSSPAATPDSTVFQTPACVSSRCMGLPEGYGFAARRELIWMQPGNVPVTYADYGMLERDLGFTLHIPIQEGLRRFSNSTAQITTRPKLF